MHSAGPRTLAADRSVYALWPLAAGCHTIDYYYYYYSWSPVRISPMTRGIFCDSAQIRPVVATRETPMTGATPKSSWNFEWFTKGGPSTHVQKGV